MTVPHGIDPAEHGLSAPEAEALSRMWSTLETKRLGHRTRRGFRDADQRFEDLGIAIPPHLKNFRSVLGWVPKAVTALASRVNLEEFILPGGDPADYGVTDIWRANRLDSEFPQMVDSMLTNACAFVAVTYGDPARGEPSVLVSTYDATMATGLWRPASRDLGCALLIQSEDPSSYQPTRFTLVTPTRGVEFHREAHGPWRSHAAPHSLGRVPVEVIPYRPTLTRPFGRSRITKPMMAITHSAMRSIARTEVASEFFSAPQMMLLGVDESQFVGANGERRDSWDLIIGRALALPRDEDGELPRVESLPQLTLTPFSDQMRMWASLFAAESSLPLDALGVVQDNPSSAEAMYAAEKDLIVEATSTGRALGVIMARVMATAVQLEAGSAEPIPELVRMTAHMADPSLSSRSATVDATLKLTSGENPIIPPDSRVALQMAGLTPGQVDAVMEDRSRAASRGVIDAARAMALVAQASQSGPAPVNLADGVAGGTD